MMEHTLRELDAHFIKRVRARRQTWRPVQTLKNADGVSFLCPVCFEKNRGSHGTHLIICWFRDRDVPSDWSPGPGRWAVSAQSASLDDLTFVYGTPVQAKSVGVGVQNSHAHFFVEGGMVVNTSRDLHEPEVQQ